MPEDLEDIHPLLADGTQTVTAKVGEILDVDLARKRISVKLADGNHALIGAPDSFFEAGANVNVGDLYVAWPSGDISFSPASLWQRVETAVHDELQKLEEAVGLEPAPVEEAVTEAALAPEVTAEPVAG